MHTRSHSLLLLALGATATAAACADDPIYVQPTGALEVGVGEGEGANTAAARMFLPVEVETPEDAATRAELAADLGIDVPYVKLDDVSLSIEYYVKNLSNEPGEARVKLNGGTEYFYYVPTAFVIDPEEDEEPPPLTGDIPIPLEGGASFDGVFREDAVREAAIDLELITRGGLNAFAAVLQVQEDVVEMTTTDGMVVPRDTFGQMVQFDLILEATTHMVMEYDVRVRDHRGILHDELLDAPAGELTTFAPVEFVPPPPPPDA